MFRVSLFVVLLAHTVYAYTVGTRAGCSISVNGDLGEPQPLLLKINGPDWDAFHFPEDNLGTLTFAAGETLNLACTRYNLSIGSTTTPLRIAEATCVSGTTFRINGVTTPFSSITCSSYPFHTARYTGRTCQTRYREIEIGFEVESRFLTLIYGCFDDASQNTLYTWFNLTSAIGGYQRSFPRPSFIQDSFYSVGTPNVDTLYTRARQRITLNNLLGLPADSTQYIHATNDFFLARGHLTAKTDFVYGASHRATFHFVNVAPQFQTFNGGNWERLESSVRNYASDIGLDLIVYTGVYGVTTLPHATTGRDVELYLYVDSNNNYGLPVPQLYWKFVYEPISQAGVVFVGVNNPYHNDTAQDRICTDITDSYDYRWLSWNKNNQQSGYSYGCTVEDFRRVVNFLPEYPVTSLLV